MHETMFRLARVNDYHVFVIILHCNSVLYLVTTICSSFALGIVVDRSSGICLAGVYITPQMKCL